MLSRRSLFKVLFAAAAVPLAAGLSSEAEAQYVGPRGAPPPPRREPRPPARRGYTWVPGHWAWRRGPGWVWMPGYWEQNRRGFVYVGPRWVLRRGQWVYEPGRWVRQMR
ncbi:hypothetical protein [Ancylobacter sp. G4_0304]|uniref:hypothetical protein n=1 Tax=Ancylobacter sp. G4_0304 TaxID=3114289 RepID=UPI0039C72292